MATSDELLDVANTLVVRYPDFHARATAKDRKALRATAWGIIALRQSIARAAALPTGPQKTAAERRASEDEQLLSRAFEMLRDRLDMMRPPSKDHPDIEREILAHDFNRGASERGRSP